MENNILFLQKKLAVRFLLDLKRLCMRDLSLYFLFKRHGKSIFSKESFDKIIKTLSSFSFIESSLLFKKILLPAYLFNDYDRDVHILAFDFYDEDNGNSFLYDKSIKFNYRDLFESILHMEYRYVNFISIINKRFVSFKPSRIFKWIKLLFFWLIVLYNDLFIISFKSMLIFWFQYISLYNNFSNFLYKQTKFIYFNIYSEVYIFHGFKNFFSNVSLNFSVNYFFFKRVFFRFRNFFVYFFSMNVNKSVTDAKRPIYKDPYFINNDEIIVKFFRDGKRRTKKIIDRKLSISKSWRLDF